MVRTVGEGEDTDDREEGDNHDETYTQITVLIPIISVNKTQDNNNNTMQLNSVKYNATTISI